MEPITPLVVKTPLTVAIKKTGPDGKAAVEEREVRCDDEFWKDKLLIGYKPTNLKVLRQSLKDHGADGIEVWLGDQVKRFHISELPRTHVPCENPEHKRHFFIFYAEGQAPKPSTDELPIMGNVPHDD